MGREAVGVKRPANIPTLMAQAIQMKAPTGGAIPTRQASMAQAILLATPMKAPRMAINLSMGVAHPPGQRGRPARRAQDRRFRRHLAQAIVRRPTPMRRLRSRIPARRIHPHGPALMAQAIRRIRRHRLCRQGAPGKVAHAAALVVVAPRAGVAPAPDLQRPTRVAVAQARPLGGMIPTPARMVAGDGNCHTSDLTAWAGGAYTLGWSARCRVRVRWPGLLADSQRRISATRIEVTRYGPD